MEMPLTESLETGVQAASAKPATAGDSGPSAGADTSPSEPPVDCAEEEPKCDSAAEAELINNWPTIDKSIGGLGSHARRWPVLLLTLGLVGAGSWFAMRIGPHKSQAVASSGFAATAATTSSADGPLSGDTGQGEARPTDGLDRLADLRPASADTEPKPENTVEPEPGRRPQLENGETPSQAGEVGNAAPAAATVAAGELGERCRKTDAGGRGKPMTVLAACRPAIEAEPEAADIMVILARVATDRGRVAEARTWAKKALEIKRDLPDAYVFLGGAEQSLGRPAEAKAAYKKYLELAPSGRHAQELRAVINSM